MRHDPEDPLVAHSLAEAYLYLLATPCGNCGEGPVVAQDVSSEDCVESATLVDLNMGYKIPNMPATLQLAVTNLFNTPYRSFVGVPDIGRFALLRVKYDLF